MQFFVVFEKFARAYLFQIKLETLWLPIQITRQITHHKKMHNSSNNYNLSGPLVGSVFNCKTEKFSDY